jgi:ribosome-associated protein
MIEITPGIVIEEDEVELRFIRASGPGGQNVNKVSSAAQLRFDAGASRSLPEEVRRRLAVVAGKRMTSAGVLTITARRFRSQEQNRADALGRLVELLRTAAQPPTPRIPTKPTRASKERRLQSKRRRAESKRLRSTVEPSHT